MVDRHALGRDVQVSISSQDRPTYLPKLKNPPCCGAVMQHLMYEVLHCFLCRTSALTQVHAHRPTYRLKSSLLHLRYSFSRGDIPD